MSISTQPHTGSKDPVLRILGGATLIATFGRGAFITLTVLYFTGIVGLQASQVAVILTLANALGVVSSLIVGHLSDRISARRTQFVLVCVQAVALAAYSQTHSFWSVLWVACIVSMADRGANVARSAVIARAFTGTSRVTSRSVLRTVTNIGIALGGAAASIPLAIGTPRAFQLALLVSACFTAASATQIWRLPQSVDAPSPEAPEARPDTTGGGPLRDLRYLAVTGLAGVFAIQFGIFEIGLPQWIVHHTPAPAVLVSIAITINTVMVIALQIPLSRGTDNTRHAGRVFAIAGVAMAGACVLYAWSGSASETVAIILLLAGVCAHTMAEILSSAGGWGLSFELADARRAGSYQGVFAMGTALAIMLAPSVVTMTALLMGASGWAILAVMFLLSGTGMYFLARQTTGKKHSSDQK